MKRRLPGRSWRMEMDRLWLDDTRGYSVEWRIRDADAELVVVRLFDSQVVDRMPWQRVLSGAGDVEKQWEVALAFLKRAADKDAKSTSAVSKEGESFAKKYAAIMEYLTADKWPEGEERQVSTLLVFSEDGIFKVCLNDRDMGRSLWVSGPSIPDALEALESTLRHGGGEWRASGQFKGKKAPKRS